MILEKVMFMKIQETEERNNLLLEKLLTIWEESVIATHLFLAKNEIKKIKSYVPAAIKNVQHLVIAYNKNNIPLAFIGTEGQRIEMLFVSPQNRGQGIGKKLVQYAVSNYSINELTVNEQNPQAVGFYEHLGFKVHKRTETDEQGNPYPLLYMRRE